MLSLRVNVFKSVNIWQCYRQERGCLMQLFCASGHHTAKLKKVRDAVHRFPVTMPNIHRFKNFFTGRQSSKPVLIWLFTILPHLRYVTTVRCNLSLVTSLVCDFHAFSGTNVLQGSAATHMRCGGIFNKYFAANKLKSK